VYRAEYNNDADDSAGWRIPTQAPPKNSFIPDDLGRIGDAWQASAHWGAGGGTTAAGMDSEINLGNAGGDAGDDDEYNGEDETPDGLGHLEKRAGKWVPDYLTDPYSPRVPSQSPADSVYMPFQDGLKSKSNRHPRSFLTSQHDVHKWTRATLGGSNPTPVHDGAYNKQMGGFVAGNRASSGLGALSGLKAWFGAPVQQLNAMPMQRTARALEGRRQQGAVGTQWMSSDGAASSARAAASARSTAAAARLAVAFAPYAVPGTADSVQNSQLWGDSYDASQSSESF